MNTAEPTMPMKRLRWEWAACAGLALALAAMFLWVGAGDGSRVLLAWLASGALAGLGTWLERRREAVRLYGQLLIAGGIAGFFGSICAAQGHNILQIEHSACYAWPLLAVCGAGLLLCADARRSQWLCGTGLGLAWMGVTLQQFTVFSLAANLLLVAVAVRLFQRRQWIIPLWIMLVAIHLGFLLGWPFSGGRFDADRYLDLSEYWWSLAFFTVAWAAFTQIAAHSRDTIFSPSRRRLFASLNNALFFGLGVLIVPPSQPAWFWKFCVAAGFLLLLAWIFTDRFLHLRRAYAVQGATLVALGLVSSIIGREPAALLAVASTFFVLTCEDRRHWLLRYGAGLTAVAAFALAWEPVFRSATPSLWLGVFTGAPLVFNSIWISRHRELWQRWDVLFFGAFGLGLWMLTTLAQTPAQYHPPILAIEAVIVTGSFLLLAIPEYPWLATTVVLLAQFLWFRQVGNFNSRPWWNPFIVVVCTLGLSYWWQTHGRALLPERALRWVQGIAAAVAVAILLLSVESAFGTTSAALVILSGLAVIVPYYASAIGDRFLLGFGQLLVATAVGEFIGQLTHSPLPHWLAALAPIAALLMMAPGLGSPFPGTVWESPARCLAMLYRALAAAMFVVWTLHYVSPANRFLLLALLAVWLLSLKERPAGALILGGAICAAGALLAFWMGWLGASGFRLRDLLGFLALLYFGRILRTRNLLSDELQRIGIIIGLAAVTQWVWLWVNFYASSSPTPVAFPITVVWSLVAAIIVCAGWKFGERDYLLFGWGLLLVALGRVLWVDLIASRMPMGTDPAFWWGLATVGIAMLVAALTYARRSTPPASSP